jgi:hypothetical protein
MGIVSKHIVTMRSALSTGEVQGMASRANQPLGLSDPNRARESPSLCVERKEKQ